VRGCEAGTGCAAAVSQKVFEHVSSLLRHELAQKELLGHADVSTTMIYWHALHRRALGVRSPVDRL
jgi:site-specific recombinase XerD